MSGESEIEIPILPSDPKELRDALIHEMEERRHADCLAKVQTDAVQLALDLLARDPDVEAFFGLFTRTLVLECDSRACDVWLLAEDEQRAPAVASPELWMTYQGDRLYTRRSRDWDEVARPRESMAAHLFGYIPGWTGAVVYERDDPRLPAPIRDLIRGAGIESIQTAPLVLGARHLGWIVLATGESGECEQWRRAMLEAIARQATFVLHSSRLMERSHLEQRRKAILEERNRIARDIHDNLAQGFAAILMQLQAAQREIGSVPAAVRASLDNAVVLARTHLTEAQRSVSTLRPNVGTGEDVTTKLQRIPDLGRLNLDYVSTKPGQQHGRKRSSQQLAHLQYT